MEFTLDFTGDTMENILLHCELEKIHPQDLFLDLYQEHIEEPDTFLKMMESRNEFEIFYLWLRQEVNDFISDIQYTSQHGVISEAYANILMELYSYLVNDLLQEPSNVLDVFKEFKDLSEENK